MPHHYQTPPPKDKSKRQASSPASSAAHTIKHFVELHRAHPHLLCYAFHLPQLSHITFAQTATLLQSIEKGLPKGMSIAQALTATWVLYPFEKVTTPNTFRTNKFSEDHWATIWSLHLLVRNFLEYEARMLKDRTNTLVLPQMHHLKQALNISIAEDSKHYLSNYSEQYHWLYVDPQSKEVNVSESPASHAHSVQAVAHWNNEKVVLISCNYAHHWLENHLANILGNIQQLIPVIKAQLNEKSLPGKAVAALSRRGNPSHKAYYKQQLGQIEEALCQAINKREEQRNFHRSDFSHWVTTVMQAAHYLHTASRHLNPSDDTYDHLINPSVANTQSTSHTLKPDLRCDSLASVLPSPEKSGSITPPASHRRQTGASPAAKQSSSTTIVFRRPAGTATTPPPRRMPAKSSGYSPGYASTVFSTISDEAIQLLKRDQQERLVDFISNPSLSSETPFAQWLQGKLSEFKLSYIEELFAEIVLHVSQTPALEAQFQTKTLLKLSGEQTHEQIISLEDIKRHLSALTDLNLAIVYERLCTLLLEKDIQTISKAIPEPTPSRSALAKR